MSLSINIVALSQVSTVTELTAFDDQLNPLLFGPSLSSSDSDQQNYSWLVLERYRDLASKRSSITEVQGQDWAREHFADDPQLRVAASLQIIFERCSAMIFALQSQLKSSTQTLAKLQARTNQSSTPIVQASFDVKALNDEVEGYGNIATLQTAVERAFYVLIALDGHVKTTSGEITRLKGLMTPEHRGIRSGPSTPSHFALDGGPKPASGSRSSTTGSRTSSFDSAAGAALPPPGSL